MLVNLFLFLDIIIYLILQINILFYQELILFPLYFTSFLNHRYYFPIVIILMFVKLVIQIGNNDWLLLYGLIILRLKDFQLRIAIFNLMTFNW